MNAMKRDVGIILIPIPILKFSNDSRTNPKLTVRIPMIPSKGIDSFLKKPIKSKIGNAWLRREKKHLKVFKDPGQSRFLKV